MKAFIHRRRLIDIAKKLSGKKALRCGEPFLFQYRCRHMGHQTHYETARPKRQAVNVMLCK